MPAPPIPVMLLQVAASPRFDATTTTYAQGTPVTGRKDVSIRGWCAMMGTNAPLIHATLPQAFAKPLLSSAMMETNAPMIIAILQPANANMCRRFAEMQINVQWTAVMRLQVFV